MVDKLVKQTITFSLWVQIITTVVSLDGFRYDVKPEDAILKEILLIDPFQVTSLRDYRACVFQGAFVTS